MAHIAAHLNAEIILVSVRSVAVLSHHSPPPPPPPPPPLTLLSVLLTVNPALNLITIIHAEANM